MILIALTGRARRQAAADAGHGADHGCVAASPAAVARRLCHAGNHGVHIATSMMQCLMQWQHVAGPSIVEPTRPPAVAAPVTSRRESRPQLLSPATSKPPTGDVLSSWQYDGISNSSLHISAIVLPSEPAQVRDSTPAPACALPIICVHQ